MNKTISICQPNFLPWIGFFEMADRSDVFVMLDDVQFIKREWMNRNRILSHDDKGWQWLTVPVKKSRQDTLINEKELSLSTEWKNKTVESIRHIYSRAPFFNDYFFEIEKLILGDWKLLVDLNLASIRLLYRFFGLENNIVLSRDFEVKSRKDDKLADLCECLGADIYLANNGSKPYINPAKFHERRLGFLFQEYQHPQYSQGKHGFVSHLSAIDLLFWHGTKAREIMLTGRNKDWHKDVSFS